MWHIVVTLWLGAYPHVYALPPQFSDEALCHQHIGRLISKWLLKGERNDAAFACRRKALTI